MTLVVLSNGGGVGVGPVGEERLARYGIHTIGELAAFRPDTLASWLGEHWGPHLWHLAGGFEDAVCVLKAAAAERVAA